MDYILINDFNLAGEVYNILKINGEDMFLNQGLCHWKTPYPIEKIKDDIISKEVFLVKEDDQYIATFMLSNEKSIYFSDDIPCLYISKFAVLPLQSNKGIGSQILKYIEKYSLSKDINTLRLDVYDKSERAVNFYLRNKFVTIYKAKTKNFEVLCMQKELL